MRKEYGKALRTLFSAKMKQEFSQFDEVKVKSIYFWAGDRAYRWSVTDQLHCWMVLSPSKKDYDEFNLLIGWSKLGRYPELSMVPCADAPSIERVEFEKDEYLTRLPSLWTNKDEWWVVNKFHAPASVSELQASIKPIPANEAMAAVQPFVEDAVAKIREFAIPYLEEVSRAFKSGVCV
jgi:hypothetical protein